MPRRERPNPETDPFHPPAIPTEVCCLHCGQEYESYLIEWRETLVDGELQGFWCCPTPHCDGHGFGFDILPTDPEYRGEDGELMWVAFDDEEDEFELLDLDDEADEDDEDDDAAPPADEDDIWPSDNDLRW